MPDLTAMLVLQNVLGGTPMQRLRLFAIVEGATLIGLLLIAVPLKRLAGMDAAVSTMGPIHGFAFLIYTYLVFEAWGARDLTPALALRSLIAALIPFGTWINDRALAERARSPDLHVEGTS